jgi:hypothetical protein
MWEGSAVVGQQTPLKNNTWYLVRFSRFHYRNTNIWGFIFHQLVTTGRGVRWTKDFRIWRCSPLDANIRPCGQIFTITAVSVRGPIRVKMRLPRYGDKKYLYEIGTKKLENKSTKNKRRFLYEKKEPYRYVRYRSLKYFSGAHERWNTLRNN